MPEDGKQNDVVGDVEVCVTRGESIEIACVGAFAADDTGHRKRDDLKATIIGVGHLFESFEIVV